MPLLVECGKGDVFGRVTDEQRRQSFLLIAASPICGMDLGMWKASIISYHSLIAEGSLNEACG